MTVEGKIYNIDRELDKLYKQRDKLAAKLEQTPETHKRFVAVRYSGLMTRIREQLKLRRECQDETSGKRLKIWLKAEHPEVYEKFFGPEGEGK